MKDKISELTIENKDFKGKIIDLENSLNVKNKLVETLNTKLRETRIRVENDKTVQTKLHKAEIKSWRKVLGEERKRTAKLEQKLEMKSKEHDDDLKTKPFILASSSASPTSNSRTFCSICANEMFNYKTKYFRGEALNPACTSCDDSFEGEDSGPYPIVNQHLHHMYPSMVSHWVYHTHRKVVQNPSSIPSLISHCAKLPNPGSSFTTMEELKEEIRKMFQNMWKT